jgi:O-antigen ligase
VGPSYGRGGGASQAWRGRLEQTAALIAPALLIAALGLYEGGFGLGPRHVAGLAVWLVVVALLMLGAASRTQIGHPFYWTSGLIGGFALWSAISSLWSGSIELSVIEADRVLIYLGIFLAAFLIAQTDQRRKRFAEGIAISLTLVALLGLATRLLPDLIEVSNGLGAGARMRYPLGYWNANGLAFGIAAAMLLWLSRRASSAALRWLAVASLPAVLLALYFTFSRGGLLGLLVACGCLIALSHDRLWLLGTLAIGALGTLPALIAVQARNGLSDNLNGPTTTDQGHEVLLILLGGIALALLLFAGLRRIEARQGRLTGRAVAISRNPRALKAVALAGALLALAAAIAVGGRAWDQFSSSDIEFPNNPQQHFSDLSGAGRHDFWRVAVDAFGEKPLAGHGAGTYEFSWQQLRSTPQPNHTAHSLYLEAFAELGVIGGVLVLGLVGVLLWIGFAAWRGAGGARRETHAVLLAAMLAFAIGAAFDWFWEFPLLGAILFLAGGALVAARCTQLAPAGPPQERRFGLAVAGLAIAWVSALGLVGPLLVEHQLRSSREAAESGNFAAAVNDAESARSIEPWAASPYQELGLIAQAQGEYARASELMSEAIEREDRNWQLYYLRARVEEEAGNRAAARADLARARALNPLAPELQPGVR